MAASGVASGFQSALGQIQVYYRLQLCAVFEWCDKENAFRAAKEFNTHTPTHSQLNTRTPDLNALRTSVSAVYVERKCVYIKFAVDQRSQK